MNYNIILSTHAQSEFNARVILGVVLAVGYVSVFLPASYQLMAFILAQSSLIFYTNIRWYLTGFLSPLLVPSVGTVRNVLPAIALLLLIAGGVSYLINYFIPEIIDKFMQDNLSYENESLVWFGTVLTMFLFYTMRASKTYQVALTSEETYYAHWKKQVGDRTKTYDEFVKEII